MSSMNRKTKRNKLKKEFVPKKVELKLLQIKEKIEKRVINGHVYLVDEYNNIASIKIFGSKESAIKALCSLKNCYNCVNCINCINCQLCDFCFDCTDCHHCFKAGRCSNTSYGEWLGNVTNSKHCSTVFNSTNCENVNGCINQKDQKDLNMFDNYYEKKYMTKKDISGYYYHFIKLGSEINYSALEQAEYIHQRQFEELL